MAAQLHGGHKTTSGFDGVAWGKNPLGQALAGLLMVLGVVLSLPSNAYAQHRTPKEGKKIVIKLVGFPQSEGNLTEHPSAKPMWRTTGKYPLIAGTWWEWEERNMLVTIAQKGNRFAATMAYKEGDRPVSWRAEGTITEDGYITATLVHTQPHAPDEWLPQVRTAQLEADGNTIHGHARWQDGGDDFSWTRMDSSAAATLHRYYDVVVRGRFSPLVVLMAFAVVVAAFTYMVTAVTRACCARFRKAHQ